MLGTKFKVGRLLGRGGFGATYLAWDTNLRVRIAIKEFLPRQLAARTSGGTQVSPYSGSRDAFNVGLQQFLSEARNLAQFRDHPGIISVLDFFPENGTGYMVMEYLDGNTLEHYLAATGRLDVAVAVRLLIPVADALRACHAAGLIHRDISPDNIFLTSDGRVKVLDFGAARFAIGSRSTNLSVILKEGYAPFEQYQRNGRQGPWTDIYALTATLYRLLTGDLPVTAPDRIAGTPQPTPSEKGVKVPANLQALLAKGMAIQPEQRYQTIDAFLPDLQAVLGPAVSGPSISGPSISGPSASGRSESRTTKRLIPLVGVGGLIGGVAVLAMIWMHPAPPSDQQVQIAPVQLVPAQIAPTQTVPAQIAPPIGAAPTKIVPLKDDSPLPDKKIDSPTSDGSTREAAGPTNMAAVAVNPPVLQQQQQQQQQKSALSRSIESMREHVRQAAQAQIQLGYALKHAQQASKLLNTLPASSKNQTIIQARQTEEYQYNSAIGERDEFLDKYMAEIEWLAEHEESVVEAAVKLEYDKFNAATIDQKDAETKAQFRGAIDLLAKHVRNQRQQLLTRSAVTDDAGLQYVGGAK